MNNPAVANAGFLPNSIKKSREPEVKDWNKSFNKERFSDVKYDSKVRWESAVPLFDMETIKMLRKLG